MKRLTLLRSASWHVGPTEAARRVHVRADVELRAELNTDGIAGVEYGDTQIMSKELHSKVTALATRHCSYEKST